MVHVTRWFWAPRTAANHSCLASPDFVPPVAALSWSRGVDLMYYISTSNHLLWHQLELDGSCFFFHIVGIELCRELTLLTRDEDRNNHWIIRTTSPDLDPEGFWNAHPWSEESLRLEWKQLCPWPHTHKDPWDWWYIYLIKINSDPSWPAFQWQMKGL